MKDKRSIQAGPKLSLAAEREVVVVVAKQAGAKLTNSSEAKVRIFEYDPVILQPRKPGKDEIDQDEPPSLNAKLDKIVDGLLANCGLLFVLKEGLDSTFRQRLIGQAGMRKCMVCVVDGYEDFEPVFRNNTYFNLRVNGRIDIQFKPVKQKRELEEGFTLGASAAFRSSQQRFGPFLKTISKPEERKLPSIMLVNLHWEKIEKNYGGGVGTEFSRKLKRAANWRQWCKAVVPVNKNEALYELVCYHVHTGKLGGLPDDEVVKRLLPIARQYFPLPKSDIELWHLIEGLLPALYERHPNLKLAPVPAKTGTGA
jgi:hypothetical protein